MKFTRKSAAIVLAVPLLSFFAVTAGCNVTNGAKPTPLFGSNSNRSSQPMQQTQPNQGVVTVELHPTRGKITRGEIPMTDMMTVQDALQKSGATKKFRNLNFEVVRFNKEKGKQVKMGGSYLPEKRTAAAHYNYALRPGDRVNVTEDTSSATDSVLNPLAKILGG